MVICYGFNSKRIQQGKRKPRQGAGREHRAFGTLQSMVKQNGREFMSEARNEVNRQAGGSVREKLLGLNAQNISEHMKMAEKNYVLQQ